jgi:hypothetical protein
MKDLIQKHTIGHYNWKDPAALRSDFDPDKTEQNPHTDYKNGKDCLIAFIGLQVRIFFVKIHK